MVSLAAPSGAMPPPPTPKRPALSMKRDSSYMDTDDEASLSSSTKKLRVAFDPKIDVRIMDDWDDKSFDLVKEEVRQGIERHVAPADRRDDAQYLKLLHLLGQDVFSSDAPSTKLLSKYLLAIDARVSSLGDCGKLVSAMLDISWVGRDDTFVGLFMRFLLDLASAHPKFIPAMTERLVANFPKLPASLGRLPEETPVPRTKMFNRIHLAIKLVLRQIPSSTTTLLQTLKRHFPNDLATTKSHLQYQKHLLRLADAAPELQGEILALVMQRLVSTDMQIQQDIEDIEEEAEEKVLQRPSSKDGAAEDSDDSDIESVSESEETITPEEQRLRELRLKVSKMDGVLDLLFEYYTPLISDKETTPATNDAYQQLLSHFTNFILPYRCRHTQFLLFHFSQVSAAHTNLFAQQCLDMAFANTNSSQKLTACAYLASFIARGSHISSASVQRILEVLCHFLDQMRQKYEPDCRGPDRRTYSLYYAVAQAILYIFCFRWRDLVIGPSASELDTGDFNEDDALAEGDLEWPPGMKEIVTRNIYCRLNPLKVCSQAIVGEFAKIAHHLRFLYVFSLLESNKRVRLGQTLSYYGSGGPIDIGRRETAWDRQKGDRHHQLEAYFPFDPYQLPKSKKWVEHDYNEWKLPRALRAKEDESEDEAEYESDEESVPEEVEELHSANVVSV